MPRNGSGTYSLPAGNPVVAGDVIEAAWANTTLADVANELTNSLSRNGNGGMLAPFRVADGSVSAPGLGFTNETNTGLYRAGSGEIWLTVGGIAVAQLTVNGMLIPAGKRITLPAPVNDTDATNKEYVDDLVNPVIQYANYYLGPKSSDPTTNNSGGALTAGTTYWSTTLDQMRVYNGTNWEPMPSTSSLVGQTFSGTGAQTAFTMANPSGPAVNLEVFISGVRQVPTTDYTVSNNILTFTSAPPVGTNNIFIRYAQLMQSSGNLQTVVQNITATAGQTLFSLSSSYQPGTNNLGVYVNGLRLVPGTDYTETSSTTLTMASGATAGDEFMFVIGDEISESISSVNVSYTPAGTGAVATSVQTKLRNLEVSPEDFGAVGDWNETTGTDDHLAFQTAFAAIMAAGGGTLRLSNGKKYLIGDTLDFTNNVGVPFCIEGVGTGPFVNGSPTVIANKARIVLGMGASKRVGIDLSGSSQFAFRNLSITSRSGYAPDIGVIMQRTSGGPYCDNSYWEKVNITVSSDPAANGALGSIAIAFKRAETHTFNKCSFVADLPMLQDGISAYTPAPYYVESQIHSEYVFAGATQSMTYFNDCVLYPLSSVCFNLTTVFNTRFNGCYFPTYANGGATPQGVGVMYACRNVEVKGQIEQWGSTHATSVSRDLFYVTENCWDIDINCTSNLTGQTVFKTNSKNVYGLKLRCQGASNTMLATSAGAVYGGRVEYESTDSQALGSQYGGVEVIDTSTGTRTYRSIVGGTASPDRFEFTHGLKTAGVKMTNVADANTQTLDWYQEGAWTPVVQGSSTAGTGTYSAQAGKYTRIGNVVYFSGYVNWTNLTGAAGNLQIGGLPFTATADSAHPGSVNFSNVDNLTFSGQLLGTVAGGSTAINLRGAASGASITPVAIDTSAFIYFSGFYFV